MTIATVSDDKTFEQIKKQLNRMIEVIKVIDFTLGGAIHDAVEEGTDRNDGVCFEKYLGILTQI